MLIPLISVAIGIVFLVLFLVERTKACTPRSTILKAITSFFFMAIAFGGVAGGNAGADDFLFASLIMAGLLCGLLGDIWLDLKYAHVESTVPYTFAGFIFFLSGHVCYDLALIVRFYKPGNIDAIITPLAISLGAAVYMAFSEKIMKNNYGRYKKVVIIYAFFLTSYISFSYSMAILNNFSIPSLNFICAGSSMFVISDFILCGTYFGQGKNRPIDVISNHTFYFLAQFATAFSLCLLSR